MEVALANLNKTLEKIFEDLEYKDRDVQIKPVSSGGANYTTALFEITVTSPGKPTLELFAKVANLNETIRNQMVPDSSSSVYDKERYVYQILATAFSDIEKKHNVPLEHRYVFPKLYGCNVTHGEESFVMENLSKQKFHMISRFDPLDWEHASVSIRDLAKFHALAMALEKDYPEIYENIGKSSLFTDEKIDDMMKTTVEQTTNINLVPEEYKNRVKKFLESNENIHKLFTTRSGKNVLIHGDYRSSNIMYKRQNGRITSLPVDYQTVRIGNPFVDFHYFLAAGTDERFRKLYYKQLVDLYYTEMGLALKRIGLDIAQEYPRHLFDEEYKAFLPLTLVLALVFLPLILVSEAEAPDMSGESADVSNLFVKPNEMYIERLNGFVRDFARWGII